MADAIAITLIHHYNKQLLRPYLCSWKLVKIFNSSSDKDFCLSYKNLSYFQSFNSLGKLRRVQSKVTLGLVFS